MKTSSRSTAQTAPRHAAAATASPRVQANGDGARGAAQHTSADQLHDSARMSMQRAQLQAAFGPAAQRQGGPRAADAQHAADQQVRARGVVQREITVGADAQAKTYATGRLAFEMVDLQKFPLSHNRVLRALKVLDGRAFASMEALGEEVMAEDERQRPQRELEEKRLWDASNYTLDRVDGRVHTRRRHTAPGIWDVGRLETTHPTDVAIFSRLQDMDDAIDAMPTSHRDWRRVDNDRFDARAGGVHYQAQMLDNVAYLRSCYPLAGINTFSKAFVTRELGLCKDYDEFVRMLVKDSPKW